MDKIRRDLTSNNDIEVTIDSLMNDEDLSESFDRD